MAGQAGVVAEPLRTDDGVGAAVAVAHRRGAPVELRKRAEIGERIDHVGLAGLDLLHRGWRAPARVSSRVIGPGTERQNRSGAAAI